MHALAILHERGFEREAADGRNIEFVDRHRFGMRLQPGGTDAFFAPHVRAGVDPSLQPAKLIAKIGVGYSDSLLNRIGEPIKLDKRPLGVPSNVPSLAIAVAVNPSGMPSVT